MDREQQLAAAVLAMETRIPSLVLGAVNAKNEQLFHLYQKDAIMCMDRDGVHCL
jgi:hypothetical protein